MLNEIAERSDFHPTRNIEDGIVYAKHYCKPEIVCTDVRLAPQKRERWSMGWQKMTFLGPSDLLQRFHADFLYGRLPDLFGHPGRGQLRSLYLYSIALEYMDLFSSSLPEPYICKSSGGCL